MLEELITADFTEIHGIPELEGYAITENGYVRNRYTGSIANPIYHRTASRWVITLTVSFKVHKQYNLARLLAFVFKDPPVKDFYALGDWVVYYEDGNSGNIELDNLSWGRRGDVSKREFEKAIERSFKKFPWSEDADGVFPNPIPCPGYEGYFYFPWKMARRAINRNCDVINLVTEEKCSTGVSNTGYLILNYKNDSNASDESSSLLHRVLALLFIEVPERLRHIGTSRLHVNHINGIKTDNAIENLEWVTIEENIEHYQLELMENTKRHAVLVRNVCTGEVIRFKSIDAAAKSLLINHSALRRHLKSPYSGAIEKNGYVYKFDNGKDWGPYINSKDFFPSLHPGADVSLTRSLTVIGENVETKKLYIFHSMSSGCRLLGLNPGYYMTARLRHGHDCVYNGWRFSPFTDDDFKRIMKRNEHDNSI